jgi:mannose-6-phosphate isomerase-like protein (cupin superfamily)
MPAMRSTPAVLVLAAAAVPLLASLQDPEMPQPERPRVDAFRGFQISELIAERERTERPYLPFLDVPTMSCGIYVLAAGGDDRQSPHDQDEVYYVLSGKAKLKVDGQDHDCAPGAVLFVAARAEHRFHSIEDELRLLVFFSKAPAGGKAGRDR